MLGRGSRFLRRHGISGSSRQVPMFLKLLAAGRHSFFQAGKKRLEILRSVSSKCSAFIRPRAHHAGKC